MGELKVNDRIRIVKMPGADDPDYYMHDDTRWVFKKLIQRGRSLRINFVDKDGAWFSCRFKVRGKWRHDYVCVYPNEDTWVKVQKRKS
jgi:hypothetical protein